MWLHRKTSRSVCLLAGSALAVGAFVETNVFAQSGSFPRYQLEQKNAAADSSFPVEQPVANQNRSAAFPQASFPKNSVNKTAATTTARKSFPVHEVGFPLSEAESQQANGNTLLTQQTVAGMLTELNLQATRQENHHDFLFLAELEDQNLELFYSVFLKENGTELRVRAWLDPLPHEVISEEPLLQLLQRNSQLDQGMHYGFYEPNRRFLLETVIPGNQLSAESLNETLIMMSGEVASSWSLWSTAEWTKGAKRVAEKPELDSRAVDFNADGFEMPIRR